MAGYDAIVIGAGHNGLTAGAVMARNGMRVVVVEKNQYVGGMAATTELIRGYRYEIAGSVLFPVPDLIFEELGLDACPTLPAEVMSVNVGGPGSPPMLDQPIPVDGLFLSSTGCHGGPGVTFIPGYNAGYAVLDTFHG